MLEFNICYSLDSHYVEQLAVSMSSVLSNSNEDENINFYILDGGLSDTEKANIELLKKIKNFSIEYIKINQEDFKVCPLLKEKDKKYSSYHVTLPTYFRFKLPSLLKNIDKILYIDCDVIVRTSLKGLFKENLNNKALAMVVDAESKKEAKRLNLKRYYNAGVMLINLDFWRKNNVEEKLFNYAKNNSDKILWQDQDIVNIVLEDRIKNISEKWNFQYFLYEKIDVKTLSDCSIIHLAGRFKPWLIPFEHPIYDFYYYYLSFTPWKNKIIQYKQMSGLKYLKNNIGGSETNILIAATDEDIQKVYKEITNSYKFTEESCKLLNARFDIFEQQFSDFKFNDFDNSISKVYEEISKNYEYTNELNKNINEKVNQNKEEIQGVINSSREEITVETDNKISKIYEEISKNYEYTNELNKNINEKVNQEKEEIQGVINSSREEITVETDEKISKVYEEISKNYEYTNELNKNINEKVNQEKEEIRGVINSSREEITVETDNKISKIYEEISKNYDYTKELNTSSKNLINKTKTEIEGFVNKSVETISELHDEKISKVYEEISKNYEYTNKLNKNIDEKVNQNKEEIRGVINSSREEITVETDNKISKVYEEISKNYEYTNELNKNIDKKVNQEKEEIQEIINRTKEEITEKTDKNLSDIYEEITKNHQYLNKLIEEKEEKIKNNGILLQNDLNKKINDINISLNESTAKTYNILEENHRILDTKVEQKNYEQYKRYEELIYKLEYIEKQKINCEEVNFIKESINNTIRNIENNYSVELIKLRELFEEELNKQRIKYEKKLIEMEKLIEAMDNKYQPRKVGLIQKIKNKKWKK